MRPAALVLAAGLLAVVLPTSLAATTQAAPGAAPAAAQPAPAVPTTVAFDEAVDSKAEYQGQALCEPAPKPGTKALGALIKKTYPAYPTIGFERDCSVGGQSEHKDGRALDWMVSVRDPAQKASAQAFLKWLLAPDANGVTAAMARRIGVMYIGWDDKIWRGYGTTGWAELFDCQSNPARATTTYDTYCHRNHIHISLTWDGARAWTSFYDGSPLTTPVCTAPAATPTVPASAALQLVPVRAVRVLDTSTAAGVPDVCRASGPSWSGQKRAVSAKVTGIGPIPRSGVGAVLVRVYPLTTNTTTSLSVFTTGTTAPATAVASSGYANRSVASTYVVPVASDGTIRVQSAYGATHVAVDVLAWAPTATALAATAVDGGNIHVQPSTRAVDVTVDPTSTMLVDLVGLAGVPASGLAGVQLQVSASAAASGLTGSIRVGSVSAAGAPELPRRFTVAYGGTVVRSAAVAVASTDGRIALRNDSANPVSVSVDVTGWYGAADDATGDRLVPRAPVKAFTSTVAAAAPTTLTLPATAVPAGATAVVLSVSTRGVAGSGALSIAADATPTTGRTADVISTIWTTDLVVVPIGADRTLTLATTAAGGAEVRATLLATLR